MIIKGANESDEEAGERMKEVYARAVAWEVVDKIIVGEDSNELASFSLLCRSSFLSVELISYGGNLLDCYTSSFERTTREW